MKHKVHAIKLAAVKPISAIISARKAKYLVLNVFTTCLFCSVFAEERTWVSAGSNHKIQGKFVSYSSGTVEIKKQSGQNIKVRLDKISHKDQEYALTKSIELRAEKDWRNDLETFITELEQQVNNGPFVRVSDLERLAYNFWFLRLANKSGQTLWYIDQGKDYSNVLGDSLQRKLLNKFSGIVVWKVNIKSYEKSSDISSFTFESTADLPKGVEISSSGTMTLSKHPDNAVKQGDLVLIKGLLREADMEREKNMELFHGVWVMYGGELQRGKVKVGVQLYDVEILD